MGKEPDTDWEYLFSNFCLALALLANAAIIGSATNVMANLDAGAVAKKNQMDEINTFMHSRKVGDEGLFASWGAVGSGI